MIYFLDLIQTRRQRPGQDLVSHLVAAEIDGERLSDIEIALNCYSFLLGGNETTKYAAAGGLFAFSTYPAAWQRLRQEPMLMDSAIEEILRWTSPFAHVVRVAVQDCVIRNRRSSKGKP